MLAEALKYPYYIIWYKSRLTWKVPLPPRALFLDKLPLQSKIRGAGPVTYHFDWHLLLI